MRRASLGSLLTVASLLIFAGASTSMPATAATPDELAGLDYVSLGDSYSAGFGLTPYSNSSPFDGSPNGCYQAEQNYPHRVAANLGLDITDETCSGAISANLGYPGGASFPIPVSADPLPELPAGDQLQVTLSGMTAPALQIAGLSADTDVVTIAIGGNDLGFANVAAACIRDSVDAGSVPLYLHWELGLDMTNCAEYFGNGNMHVGADLFARLSGAVEPRIAATLDAVKQLAPNAQVFVVGYPQIAPADASNACFSSMENDDAVPFSGTDLRFIHAVEGMLDDSIQTQAVAHGFHFVSSWSASADHTLCSEDPWISGLTAYLNLESSCDDGYLPQADGYVCVKLGALHPDEDGVSLLADLATSAIGAAFHVTPATASAAGGATTAVTGGGFHPGETVRIELRAGSATLPLGTVTADAAGGFQTQITIPADAPFGAHTIYGVGETSDRSFGAALEIAPSSHEGGHTVPDSAQPELAASGVAGFPAAPFGAGALLLGTLLLISASAAVRRSARKRDHPSRSAS